MVKHRRTGIIILGILSLAGGLATGRDIFFNMSYLLALLLILSLGWAWSNMKWVHLSRITRTRRTQVGRPLEERFTIQNKSIIPKLWLEIRDYSTLPAHYSSKVVNSLGSRARFTWRVTTICQQRGRYRLGPIQLRTSDPFGLFPLQRDLELTKNVVVYPMTVDVHQFSLPIGILPGGDALRRRTHYVTTNAAGVRDYAPGDSFSRIHWASTARRNRLIVKEFELDPLADIWIVPDMAVFSHVSSVETERQSSEPMMQGELPVWLRWSKEEYKLPDSTEEYTVTVAASLAQHFLRLDRAVGLLAYGQAHEVIQPDRGERQINRILETLAVIRAEGHVAIEDVLDAESHVFPRGTTVIIITPSNREDFATGVRALSGRGLRIVTVLIDAASFGGRHSSESLLEMLRASNIVSYHVQCKDDLTTVLSAGKSRSHYQKRF
jgi:uncharacterized protein (DUF58 family)